MPYRLPYGQRAMLAWHGVDSASMFANGFAAELLVKIDERSKFQTQKGLIFGLV